MTWDPHPQAALLLYLYFPASPGLVMPPGAGVKNEAFQIPHHNTKHHIMLSFLSHAYCHSQLISLLACCSFIFSLLSGQTLGNYSS